ncbi:MAG: radical SAM protein [Candidatus Lokiarchaeota archaeon]|nr:radical SAM protein [Candidatus Lokiarchaeota archaeon]
MVKYIYKKYKSALNKLKFPDPWFWARYTINPYSGCTHACIYCDARSQRYYLEDFENEIIIKENIVKKLDQTISRSRTLLPDVIGPGGVCDAYQPIEEKIENTRNILKIVIKHNYPVNIATKNRLIIRDIDILKKIAENTWSTIGFSITTLDEEIASILEPFSTLPKERITAIKEIKQKAPKIQVGTYFIPNIPFVCDSDDNIERIIKESKDAGADFIVFSPSLTIRDLQKVYFIKKLNNSKLKIIVEPLLKLYNKNNYAPFEYTKKLNKTFLKYCEKYKLPIRIKRWIPLDYRKWNYKIAELLLNKEYMESMKSGRRNKSMMWAGLYLNNLKESIMEIYKRGELGKLTNFSKSIIDYVSPYLEKSKDFNQKKGIDRFI